LYLYVPILIGMTIYPAQPMAHGDNLNLLARFITEAEATIDAVEASITEIKRDFNLL
jgi:hypothetical protein